MGKQGKGNPAAREKIYAWIEDGLRKSGHNWPDLAEVLGLQRHHASRLRGRRRLMADELATISEFINQPLPSIGVTPQKTPLQVLCDVNAGQWFEQSILQLARHRSDTIPRIEDGQCAVRVVGDLIARDFDDGSYAICTAYPGRTHITGDRYVLVEVERHGLFSPFVLALTPGDKQWELQTRRNPPDKHPTLIRLSASHQRGIGPRGTTDKVNILGLVIGRYVTL